VAEGEEPGVCAGMSRKARKRRRLARKSRRGRTTVNGACCGSRRRVRATATHAGRVLATRSGARRSPLWEGNGQQNARTDCTPMKSKNPAFVRREADRLPLAWRGSSCRRPHRMRTLRSSRNYRPDGPARAVRRRHRPAQSARRLAIGGVTSRNHAVPCFTAYCESLSDLSLSRVRAPLQKLGRI
jgi:hypothetical protein